MQDRTGASSDGLTRRNFLGLAVGGVAVGVVAACAPVAPSSPTAVPKAAGAAATPRSGGSLTVGTTLDIDTLDGHRLSAMTGNWRFMAYDALVAYDDKRQPQPMLAESWDFSSDAKELKLNLRKGVTFHSGRELTSEDVEWNIMRVRDAKVGASQLSNMSNWFNAVDTPDKYTVILKSEQSRPAAFDLLEFMNILDRETMEGPDAATKVVGTGPFTLAESMPGQRMRFVKNRNYWQSGRPYLDEVVLSIYKDVQTLGVNLETNTIGLALAPTLDAALRLRGDPRYQVDFKDIGNNYAIWANTTTPPTNNKLVRQAMNYAIDRKRWVDTYLKNVAGEPRALPWPPDVPAFDAARNTSYAFDLDKARSLLQQAGVSNVEMDLLYPSQSTAAVDIGVLAQMYQQDAARIGVKLNLKPLDLTTFNAQVIGRQYSGMFVSIGGFTKVEPASFLSISVAWNPAGNTPGYKSDQYTQLITSAATEPDPAKQKQVYTQLNDLILDESFGMMVSSSLAIFAMRSSVHDFKLRFTGYNVFTDTWVDA